MSLDGRQSGNTMHLVPTEPWEISVVEKVRYVIRCVRLVDWREATTYGFQLGRQGMRAELAGLGWFLIVGVPLIVVLQQTGVFPGPKPSLVDLLVGMGLLLGGVALVTLSRRHPSRAPRVRHSVRAERSSLPRY